MSLQQTQQPTTPTSPTLVHSRDTYLSACTSVPEDEVLRSEPASSIGLPRLQQPGFETEAKPKKGLAALLAGCSCLGGGGTRMVVEEKEGHTTTKVVRDPTLPRSISVTKDGTYCHIPSRKVSRKGSSMGTGHGMSRRWSTLRRAGSMAYSDADWFDAMSSFDEGHEELEDRDTMMAEVDQLVKELGAGKGPWIPEPPLVFAVPNMHFIPLPEKTGFAAYWMRDDERTTPPPQPIDVMLKSSWIVQKSHNSIPGVLFEETDKELTMTVKPRFVPPGFPRYQEFYDKTNNNEPSWALRRDLKTGRSYGKIYMTSDGTLIFRVWTRPMFGNDVDLIMEEYMRLEDDGQVLVARQCALDVKSGKRAVQYLVGRRYETPPKGHV